MGEMIVVELIAAEAFINPAPCWLSVCKGSLLFVLEGTFCAVYSKRLRMPFPICFLPFLFLDLEERTSAAEPATKEDAIFVLDAIVKLPRSTGKVEIMFPPGADKAGLRNNSKDGP